MHRNTRRITTIAGVLLLLLGLGCLNYTKADGLEHHREVARKFGLPPPGPPIFYFGIISLITGSGLVGYRFGHGHPSSP